MNCLQIFIDRNLENHIPNFVNAALETNQLIEKKYFSCPQEVGLPLNGQQRWIIAANGDNFVIKGRRLFTPSNFRTKVDVSSNDYIVVVNSKLLSNERVISSAYKNILSWINKAIAGSDKTFGNKKSPRHRSKEKHYFAGDVV
jgi:hypothetical protein